MCRCGLTCACKCMCEFESVEPICRLRSLLDSTCSHSSTASTGGSACLYLALFPGLTHHFIICSVWRCGVKMSSAHCLASHVAALALQALKASHTRPLIRKTPTILVANKTWVLARNPHAGNPHAGNLEHSSIFLSVIAIYIRIYVHCKNRSPIQSLAPMHSAMRNDFYSYKSVCHQSLTMKLLCRKLISVENPLIFLCTYT